MAKTNNDVDTVMTYSGHKTVESFSNYLPESVEGRILTIQALEAVDGLLTASCVPEGLQGQGQVDRKVKPVEKKVGC